MSKIGKFGSILRKDLPLFCAVILQIYTKLAKFARLYFSHFEKFSNETFILVIYLYIYIYVYITSIILFSILDALSRQNFLLSTRDFGNLVC